MPERVNLLRVGEGILLARDLDVFFGYDMSDMHQDVYTMKAEVIEVKTKPSHPVGSITIDAFGHKPVYVDRGMRKRALLGIGKVDYGSIDEIQLPHDSRHRGRRKRYQGWRCSFLRNQLRFHRISYKLQKCTDRICIKERGCLH